MFLPVMVLPLFAININQKEVEPLTAQIEETQLVDFNQLLNPSNLFDSSDYYSIDGYKLIFNGTNNSDDAVFNFFYASTNFVENHKYYFDGGVYALAITYFNDDNAYIQITENGSIFENIKELSLYKQLNAGASFDNYVITPFYIDLTQMYGVGNEPTIQQFKQFYPNTYYQYSKGHKEILYTGVVDTLDNTDIGSQFLYSLYNPLKDYFNLPNYMNLGGLYDWFLANLFSGYNSPVYFIIFDLMIYWLAMSILWLIFDVLMYVPSMIHKMLDKARME